MSSANRVPIRPLTEGERQQVTDHLSYAYGLSHRVWRKWHLPAWHLEEMRSIAVLELCLCSLRYSRSRPPVPFIGVVKFSLLKRLYGYVRDAGRTIALGYLEEELQCPDLDDSRTDILLEALHALPDRYREVIELRYGLSGQAPKSIDETKEEMTDPYANRRSLYKAEEKALRSLAEWLEENGCDS